MNKSDENKFIHMKNEVGIVISVCRKQCNLKQSYMAHMLDINVNTYANIERGRVDINTEKLCAIAQLLGIRAHQILALAEEILEIGELDWLPSMAKRMIRVN